MARPIDSNPISAHAIQGQRLLLVLGGALLAVLFLTPLCVEVLGTRPRKTSVSILRFAFLALVALTVKKGGPGISVEAGLQTSETPLRVWGRGFLLGMIPLTVYVFILTIVGERAFEGINNEFKFWTSVIKYIPLALVIGFLEDMLFFGFLATLLGQRDLPCVLIYAISHFLAPSKSYIWKEDSWAMGVEALQAMGDSILGAWDKPVEVIGLVFVGSTLALLCRRTGHIWLAMGVHGGWYYVRTISRKLGEDLPGQHEWLFGTDRFYDGVLGWFAIAATGLIFCWTQSRTKEARQESRSQ